MDKKTRTMETYGCMDLCKEASTDNWRRCLNDCHVGLANEARVSNEISKSLSNTKRSMVGSLRENPLASTVITVGVLLAAVSALAIFALKRK